MTTAHLEPSTDPTTDPSTDEPDALDAPAVTTDLVREYLRGIGNPVGGIGGSGMPTGKGIDVTLEKLE